MADVARQIRRRMIGIILRAFLGVMGGTLLLVFLVMAFSVANSELIPPFSQLPLFARLEGYYIGHGSWSGAQQVFPTDGMYHAITLLDAEGRIMVDHGVDNTERVGRLYPAAPDAIVVNLKVAGRPVGALVFDRGAVPSQGGAVAALLLPAGLVAAFLASLAAVVLVLLSRRVVAPLAEVIAAARAVTAGQFEARVQVQGTQDLRLLIDSFNQMAAALERNDRERRRLLADVAHELRTPISAMRGRLEGMLDGVYPADAEHLGLALKSNYLLDRLVDDLRLLTLAEARQLPFDKKLIDLQVLAAHCVEIFSAEAQEKNIQLELRPAQGDFRATLDPQRTEQVLGNLLGNALRYTPEGGRVWLELETAGTSLTLAVCDTGPGLPEADLPYIFDRFWRKDKSRARQTGGSGLGLAIARQLMEAQGGTLTAENMPAGGLRLTLQLNAVE